MAIRQGKKVSELTALNSASLNTYVVGVDNNVTYKISLDVLENAIINLVTSSTDARLNSLEQYTASFTSSLTDISNLNTFTSSYYTDSASFSNRIDAATNEQNLDNLVLTSSFNEFTGSSNNRLDNLEQSTSSFYTEDNSYPQDINFLAQFTDTKKLGKAPIYITGSNIIVSGSMEVSGSVIFLGNQFISGTIELYDVTGESDHVILFQQDRDGSLSISNGMLVPADGIRIPGGQNQIILKNDSDSEYDTNIQNIDGVGMQISASGTNNAILEIIGHSLNLQNTFTASISDGYIWVGDSNNKTYLVSTSSFASTGSNTFIGKQVLQDDSANPFTLYPHSGSLMLIAHSYNSASNHLSASSNSFINLIFKDINTEGSTIISGSNNIIKNPNTPTTGFINYIKDGNISLQGHIPQMSSSMQFPIDVNGNVLNGHSNVIMRGPTSATYWTINGNYVAGSTNGIVIGTSTANNAEKLVGQLTINNNVIQNALQIIANDRPISGVTMVSSNNILGTNTLNLYGDASILYTQNYINGTNQFTTNYSSGSTTSTIISATRNTFAGNNNNVTITGSYVTGSTTLSVVDNATFGASNTLYINADTQLAYKDYLRTIVAGSNLIISGSNWASDTHNAGTIVLGRNNVNDGIRNKTRENILIVGTGTSTTNRKTGLLIDSGSNIFVEGSLSISGSGSINGNNIVSSNTITKIETMTSASYAVITPVSGTLYIIID